jgi:hypothetical protein
MPVVAFGYGSFGDILSTIEVVTKIVSLLRRGGQPSCEWADTERQLKVLGKELANLTVLKQTLSIDPSLSTQIDEGVRDCHQALIQLYSKIPTPKGFIQTVLVARSEEKELGDLRRQIAERCAAFNSLVGQLNA